MSEKSITHPANHTLSPGIFNCVVFKVSQIFVIKHQTHLSDLPLSKASTNPTFLTVTEEHARLLVPT